MRLETHCIAKFAMLFRRDMTRAHKFFDKTIFIYLALISASISANELVTTHSRATIEDDFCADELSGGLAVTLSEQELGSLRQGALAAIGQATENIASGRDRVRQVLDFQPAQTLIEQIPTLPAMAAPTRDLGDVGTTLMELVDGIATANPEGRLERIAAAIPFVGGHAMGAIRKISKTNREGKTPRQVLAEVIRKLTARRDSLVRSLEAHQEMSDNRLSEAQELERQLARFRAFADYLDNEIAQVANSERQRMLRVEILDPVLEMIDEILGQLRMIYLEHEQLAGSRETVNLTLRELGKALRMATQQAPMLLQLATTALATERVQKDIAAIDQTMKALLDKAGSKHVETTRAAVKMRETRAADLDRSFEAFARRMGEAALAVEEGQRNAAQRTAANLDRRNRQVEAARMQLARRRTGEQLRATMPQMIEGPKGQ